MTFAFKNEEFDVLQQSFDWIRTDRRFKKKRNDRFFANHPLLFCHFDLHQIDRSAASQKTKLGLLDVDMKVKMAIERLLSSLLADIIRKI